MKEKLRSLLAAALQSSFADGSLTECEIPSLIFEVPANPDHGDFASNVAMLLAKPQRKAPRQVAEAILSHLPAGDLIESAETAGPGFINFRISAAAWRKVLEKVAREGEVYGRSATGAGRKVQV